MPKDLLFEIGVEELPASFVEPALIDLKTTLTTHAANNRLAHGAVRTYGTPRRLAVAIAGVAEKSEQVHREVLGPAVRVAFDAAGKPTTPALKFAAGQGVEVSALGRTQTSKGEYLTATATDPSRTAEAILQEALASAAHSINFRKSMRWSDVEQAFARPVHWMVALLGEEVLPVVLGDVKSGRVTYGHRFLAAGAITLKGPADYETALEKAHVLVDVEKRKARLLEGIRAAAKSAGGTLLEDEGLVDQVNNLVEWPCPVVGSFDPQFLDLPVEVLVQEMKGHQRYFSLVDPAGKLLPRFIAVSNTPVRDVPLSLRGYERVLRARLADGRFFYDEDRKIPLADRVQRLSRVVFQQKLGTTGEKVERFRALSLYLAKSTGRGALAGTVERAATLAKADLVSGMVGEFPELQGVMGCDYARHSGEPDDVALAILEHYLPRGATDALPSQDPGALVGIGDRLDTLCGLFAIGKPPTGTADPFGLRRACLAIINIALGKGLRFSLSGAVDEALRLLAPKVATPDAKAKGPAPREQILEFFRGRLKALWVENNRPDVVEAILSASFDEMVSTRERLEALSHAVGQPDFPLVAIAFRRAANIIDKSKETGPADPAKMSDPVEKALHTAFTGLSAKVASQIAARDFAGALKEIVTLKAPLDTFFDKVKVMVDEPDIRANRLRLLGEIAAMFSQLADFSKIQLEGNA
jgi:glycyl-tRNA synthetase beta chain